MKKQWTNPTLNTLNVQATAHGNIVKIVPDDVIPAGPKNYYSFS